MRTRDETVSCASEMADVTSLADLAAAFNRLALAVESKSLCPVVCQCTHLFLDLTKDQSTDQSTAVKDPGE